MKAVGARSFREYYECLTVKPEREGELRNLLDELTRSETGFFRDSAQIDAVTKVVVPAIMMAKREMSFARLRIWSAGCSTGEEPFSLAIQLLEQKEEIFKDWTFEILATDFSDRVLSRAKEGVYNEYSLRRVSSEIREKYFLREGDRYRVRNEVREVVSFNRLNLHDDSKMVFMKGVDIIFCCNVLIYFDGTSKRRTIEHFYYNLIPNGYLFLGNLESLHGLKTGFQLVHFPGATAYLKPGPTAYSAGAQ